MLAYELAEVRLTRQGEKYMVTVAGEPALGSPYENPLEAWTRFIDLADVKVRRRIGDYLETQGRNRYTGEIKEERMNAP